MSGCTLILSFGNILKWIWKFLVCIKSSVKNLKIKSFSSASIFLSFFIIKTPANLTFTNLIYLMKSYKFSNSQHLRVISRRARVKSLNDSRNITKDTGVHQSWNKIRKFKSFVPESFRSFHLHPTNITQIVKIFSASVLGATLPKPTDVSEVKVK